MIQTVVKRDGRIVGFNEEKIASAIRKAMLHTDKGEDLQLIRQITDHISFRGASQMTVDSAALPEKRKPATSFWKSSISNRTTSHVKTQI